MSLYIFLTAIVVILVIGAYFLGVWRTTNWWTDWRDKRYESMQKELAEAFETRNKYAKYPDCVNELLVLMLEYKEGEIEASEYERRVESILHTLDHSRTEYQTIKGLKYTLKMAELGKNMAEAELSGLESKMNAVRNIVGDAYRKSEPKYGETHEIISQLNNML